MLPRRSIWIQCREWVNAKGQHGGQWGGKAITFILCCFLTLTILSSHHPKLFLSLAFWRSLCGLKKNINILSKTILGFINGGFLLYLTENQVYLTLLHASLHCDFPPQNLWLLSHWLVVWTSFSVHTPSSVSQRAGCVTRSPTVLISLMKSIVPMLYPELFLLRAFVLLVIFSVQIITASHP